MRRFEDLSDSEQCAAWRAKIREIEEEDAEEVPGKGSANGSGRGHEHFAEPGPELGELPIDEEIAAAEQVDLDVADLMRAARMNKNDITEADVSDVFAERAAGRLIYVHGVGRWFDWTGMHWRQDDRPRALEAIKRLGQAISEELPAKEVRLRRSTRRAGFARGVETFAQADPRLARGANELDRNLDLLGTPGGTYDLRTGQLVTTDPQHLITKQTLVAPVFTRPRGWLRFLAEVTGGDRMMIRWLQVWLGYSATGHVSEEQLAFVYGEGGNGKGTFLTTTEKLLGDYALTASMQAFIATRYQGHTTEIAHLRGARYVIAQETAEGARWDEERLKALTGGDRITARFMRQDNITFEPQLTLTMSGNHAPSLRDVDDAIRRRFNVVPFTRKPRRVNKRLKRDLLELEGPAILGWIIQGARRWYADGLPERSMAMKSATASYFEEQDLFGAWVKACCYLSATERDKLKNLHKSYVEYTGDKSMTAKGLAKTLREKGFRSFPTQYGETFQGLKSETPATVA